MNYFVICLLLFLASILFLYFKRIERRGNFPPGPKGYPVVGNLFDVDLEYLYAKFDEWAKQYGDIFHVNIFGKNIIVLNSGGINKEAFLQEPNATILSDRTQGMVGKDFYFNYHDIAFTHQNESTIRRRKLGYRLMKAYGEGMKRIEKLIQNELTDLIGFLDHQRGGVIKAEEMVNRFLCGVLTSLINGRHYDVNGEFVSTIKEFDHQLTLMMDPGYDMLFQWFPFVRYIPCKAAREYKHARIAQDKFFAMLREETMKHPEDKGIYQDLLEAQKTERDKNGELWIQDDDINGIMTNLVTAAFLTTKGTLMSLVRYLMENLDVQRRLQEEVDTVVGDRELPCLNHRRDMPYTNAVVMETLRTISHVPLSVTHAASKHTTLRGYDIPKDATIISNLWTVHHDEKVYPNPLKFHPGRFLDENGQTLPYDSEPVRNFLAFGVGKRSCIGEVFARSRIFLFVSAIMQHYTFLPDENNPLPPFDPRKMHPGIVRIPQEFNCKVEKRTKQA